MRRIVLGVVVIAVIAAAALWWFVWRDTSPAPASLAGSTASGSGATHPLAGTWTVQEGPGVFAGYRMEEKFGGDALSRTAVGRTPAVSGTFTIASHRLTSASVTADLTGLRSDQARRDAYIHAHALETDRYPNATFRLGSAIALPDARVGISYSLRVGGQLTLHGVTRSVLATVQARWDGATLSVAGSIPITLADYGIERPDIAGLVSTAGGGVLEVQLRLVPA